MDSRWNLMEIARPSKEIPCGFSRKSERQLKDFSLDFIRNLKEILLESREHLKAFPFECKGSWKGIWRNSPWNLYESCPHLLDLVNVLGFGASQGVNLMNGSAFSSSQPLILMNVSGFGTSHGMDLMNVPGFGTSQPLKLMNVSGFGSPNPSIWLIF